LCRGHDAWVVPYLLATPNDQALVSSLPASSPAVTSTVCRLLKSLPVVREGQSASSL